MKPPQYLKGAVFELGLKDLATRVNAHGHFWRSAPGCDTMPAKPEVHKIWLSCVLLLLALSVFINYLDRGNLSIAAPLLKNEFQLSATQLGVLLSSFFWTYSFFLPLSGWLVDRLDVKWVIASGFVLWSAATAASGAARCMHSAHRSLRDWRWGRRIGFLSSMLDHFVAVFPGAQTWLRQCDHSCRHGPGAGGRYARRRNSDEPIWVAPGFSRGGPDEPVMATAMASLDAKRP